MLIQGLWSKDRLQGRGIALLPGEVVIRGNFRQHKLQGKAFVTVGGQVMLICDMINGKVASDVLRVQLDSETGAYYAINMRNETLESINLITPENFEMREEYFMNYDFLRRHGEKTDHLGRSFKMLDFEDGGMYFGIVQDELPSGLGAFVYSDLKFHCGNYRDGLMNSLSRIHFGNGDVYDGMTEDGKMHGEGFFFDCENNDWVFGDFESDNCTEVIEQGDGFPRAEILKFRSLFRQSSTNYYGRDTEPLTIDLDLLIDFANRDISHLKPDLTPPGLKTPMQIDDNDSEGEEELVYEGEEETGSEEMESESSHKNSPIQKQDHLRESESPIDRPDYFGDRNQKVIKPTVRGPQLTSNSQADHPVQITQKMARNGLAFKHRSEQKRQDLDMHPHDKRVMPVPEVHVVSPGYEENRNLVTPKRDERNVLKKTQGNQIVQGAQLLKPKSSKSVRTENDPYLTENDMNGNQAIKHQNQLRIQDISGVSSVKDRDESRDLRNISIQTEDKMVESTYKNDEASISYLKGIHSMIDDLKQMVSDKILVGRETEKIEESILFKIAEVKKQVEQSFASKNNGESPDKDSQFLGFHVNSGFNILQNDSGQHIFHSENFKSEGTGLPPETRLPLDFNFNSQGNDKVDWNMTIDRQLEEKRLKDIEDALAKKFGKIDEIRDAVPEELEPIKETTDGEDDEDLKGNKNRKGEEGHSSEKRITLGMSWDELQASLKKRKSQAGVMGFQELAELDTDPDQIIVNVDEKSQVKEIEPRILPRKSSQEVITEADEKNFYMGEPDWGENNRKSSWAIQSDKTSTLPGNHRAEDSKLRDDDEHNQANTVHSKQVNPPGHQPVWNGHTEDDLRPSDYSYTDKALSFGNKQSSGRLQVQVNINGEIGQTRESNFMESKRGGESRNSASLLPGMAPESIKHRPVNPWYFLNPYLYDAAEEIDTTHN